MKLLNMISILILTFVVWSCGKEDISKRPINQADMWDCYNNSEWTAATIKDELIGNWNWIYSESYWTPNEGRNTENQHTIIEFVNDSTLNVLIDGELKGTTKWTIKPKDGELHGIELDSSVTSLVYGRILICEDVVEFNNSYVDGSDNYFQKIE